MNMSRLSLAFLLFYTTIGLHSQAISQWTVKPEWVKAHEFFLSGDAMRGRGSATPDELIAAAYVASQFQQYGLKPGLSDGTYIQAAQLAQPVVDGKASIELEAKSSEKPLHEGPDFYLPVASGQSVTGPLQKIAIADLGTSEIKKDSVVLVIGEPAAAQGALLMRFPYRAAMAGAKLVIEPDSPRLRSRFDQNGDKTQLSPYLPDA